MKKISRILIFVVFVLVLLVGNKVVVNASSDDFDDFTFDAQNKIIDHDKTTCKITWKTQKEIKYLNVIIVLPNKFEQNPYNSMRENLAGEYSSTYINGYYLNVLTFDVYYHQIGNIKAKFEYSFDYVIEEFSEDILECDYVFVTGVYWIEKQPVYVAILVGSVITIVTCIVTYVVIENSRRSILLGNVEDTDLEDEEIEEENNVVVPKKRRKAKTKDEK